MYKINTFRQLIWQLLNADVELFDVEQYLVPLASVHESYKNIIQREEEC